MKTILFTTLIAVSATLAAAKGAPQPAWDHANDSGPIVGLQQVEQPQGQRFKKKTVLNIPRQVPAPANKATSATMTPMPAWPLKTNPAYKKAV
ncbi:hypothetical protein ACFPVS_08400 [Neisseria weixii]|uniref:hypothetical protein n=1 Tax=Neisseria weixii TaxID=1853276 RepID=UPI001F3E9887|nr:hypothetical protein [Neisseria weixii]